MWPRDDDAELDAFYGRPDGSAKWEVTHLTYIFTPWKSYLAGTKIELKRGIRVHKKVAESLTRIFASLWETFGKSQKAIEAVDLHQIGGAYYFRARRGSKRLSNHARGIAIDIDPADNPMRKGSKGDMDPRVVQAFEAEGWRWGASFGDPMHFEAVFNGKNYAISAKENAISAKTSPERDLGAWIKTATPLIKRWEAFRAKRYWDVDHWAIGYGSHADKTGLPEPITEEQASKLLADYLADLADQVSDLVTVPVGANQGAALLSFAYNLGIKALAKSTLLRLLNGGDYAGAAGQFGRWVKAKGKTLPGLVKRRADEAALFLS